MSKIRFKKVVSMVLAFLLVLSPVSPLVGSGVKAVSDLGGADWQDYVSFDTDGKAVGNSWGTTNSITVNVTPKKDLTGFSIKIREGENVIEEHVFTGQEPYSVTLKADGFTGKKSYFVDIYATLHGGQVLEVGAMEVPVVFDGKAPSIEGTPSNITVSDKVYMSSNSKVEVNYSDEGSGIASVTKDGSSVTDTTYTVNSKAELTNLGLEFEVKDKLGNVTKKTLGELIGAEGLEVVWDDEAPKIGRLKDLGFDKDKEVQVYEIEVSDGNLKKAVLHYGDESVEIKGNRAEIPVPKGTVLRFSEVKVSAEDLAGNKSDKVFKINNLIDRKAPEITGATLKPGVVASSEKATVISKGTTLQIDAIDEGGDIKGFYVNDVFYAKRAKIELPEGEIVLKAEDTNGNISDGVNLNTLVNTKSNKFVIQEEKGVFKDNTKAPDKVVDGVSAYRKDKLTLSYEIENKFAEKALLRVNGTEIAELTPSNGVITVNHELDGEGVYDVEVVVKSWAGFEDEVHSFKYGLDQTAPKVISAELSQKYVVKGDKIVVQGTSADLKIKVEDLESGVDQVRVNGRVYSSQDIPLKKGTDTIEITDKAGNTFGPVTLVELLGHKGKTVVYDDNAPKITLKLPKGYLLDNDTYWYNKDVTIEPKVEDDNLKTSTVKVNGEEVSGGVVKATADGKYVVLVEAEDVLGAKTSKQIEFWVDKSAPTNLKAESNIKPNAETDNAVYFKELPTITLSSEDAGVGSPEYIVNGRTIKGNTFTLKEGTTTIKVKDKLGNVTNEFELKDLMGWKSNNVVSDVNAPTIKLNQPKANLVKDGKNWYSKDVDVPYSVEDDNLDESKTEVRLNGESVTGNSVRVTAEGRNEITIKAVDHSGNVAEKSIELWLDKTSPKINGLELAHQPNADTEEGVFFQSLPKTKASVSDAGVGGVRLKVNGKLVDGLEFTLPEGVVKLSVVDELGNESEEISVKDLLSWKSDNVILDNTLPEVEFPLPDGYVEKGGKIWYSKDITLEPKVTDSNLKEVEYKLNGENIEGTKFTVSKDGLNTLEVIAKDKANNVHSEIQEIWIDRDAPKVVEAKVNKPFNAFREGLFFKETPSVNFTSDDGEGVGVKGELLNGERSSDNSFTLTNDSENFVQAEDLLGNLSEKFALRSLIEGAGEGENKVFVDGEAPRVNITRSEGEWFAEDVEFTSVLGDNTALHHYEVLVNGKLVQESEFSGLVRDGVVKTSTSGLEANEDGSYQIVVKVWDKAGNVSESSDLVYIDRDNPEVTRFEFVGDGKFEGKEIGGGNEISFFVKDSGRLRVHAKDEGYSSGLSHVKVSFENGKVVETAIENGVAEVELPRNYRGYVSAVAFDKVNRVSEVGKPSGFVVEDRNFSLSQNSITVKLPKASGVDANGLPLYNSDFTAEIVGEARHAGVGSVEVNGLVDSVNGSGDYEGKIISSGNKFENLLTTFKGTFRVQGNENGMSIVAKLLDRVGYGAENTVKASIDKDAPVVSVTYNENNESGYYNKIRRATVTVTERNFDPAKAVFSGTYGNLSGWSSSNGVWTNVIEFRDGDYDWSFDVVDRAGNKANTYKSGKFTVDTVKPVLDVSFDNNDVQNGKYYKASRTATIKVTEKNFDPSLVKVEGGSVSGWSSNGDVHVANVVFAKDGVYNLTVGVSDKAGNSANPYNSGEFVVDLTVPNVEIGGATDGVAFHNAVDLFVKYADENLDEERTSIELIGREKGRITLAGGTGLKRFVDSLKTNESDDLYTLIAKVYDKAGNITEKRLSFIVNRGGSVFTSTAVGTYNQKVVSKVEDIVFSEVTVEEVDESSIQVVLGNGEIIQVPSEFIKIEKTGGVDGKWVYTYTISKDLFKEDGKYSVQLLTKTKSGLENSSINQEVSFTKDTQAPEIIIGGVESNAVYEGTSRLMTIDVRDLSGAKEVEVFVNGEKVGATLENGTWKVEIPESSKKMDIKVRVTDFAGNVSEVELSNVLISSNVLLRLWQNIWFKVLFFGLWVLVAVACWFLILAKRRKKKEVEEELAKFNAAGSSSVDSTSDDTPTTKI